jgi:exopolysaccharide biosynthesis polyprenyl glycosylphosphotransferase
MKRSELTFTLALVPIDFLALIAAGVAAYFLRFHPYFTEIRPIIFNLTLDSFVAAIIPVAILWIGVFALSGLYSTQRKRIASELVRIGLACSASMALVFALTFFSRVLFDSRFIAIAAWVLTIIFVSLTRLIVRAFQKHLLKVGVGVHKVVLIGNNTTSKTLSETFTNNKRLGYKVVEIFESFSDSTKQKIKKLNRAGKLDEIILADPDASRETTLSIISFTDTEHLGFLYSADLFAAAVGRSVVHMYSGVPVIEVRKTPLDGWGSIYKRLFDITISLILIIITSPIMIITAIAIKLNSKGPVLFARLDNNKKSMRIGQNGKPFHYFKFRSMKTGTHSMRYKELTEQDSRKGTPLVKIKDDPRVTSVGSFIRKFSIDEIPEFFLVLTGKMSLVGPRPHLPEEVKKYKPEHKKVHTIKPGITGMAQISGRADLDFDEEIRLDTYYIEHWSPWLDLYILLKTPLVVIFRKGAY